MCLQCKITHSIGLIDPLSRVIYEETIERIEKWSRFSNIAIIKVTLPCCILPIFLLSYFNYFINDMGSDAFELPDPIW